MRKAITLLCLLIGISWASAQTKITGTVVSADDGLPVIGASVLVKGTTIGTITDANGQFNVNLSTGSKKLVVSYIGMITSEVDAKQGVKVVLATDTHQLNEVVVVAYGVQSTRKVASAISSVKGDQFKDAANVSLDQALQGRASGVQITSPAGVVGQPPIVRVRGVNSITSGTQPLYVVDGVPILTGDLGVNGQANGLADINPDDILSIDVLKDASAAAMYGSRAANGVVLITTKSGSKGKTKVTYDGWVGFSNPTGFIKVMNAQQYVDYKNMAVKNRYGTDAYDLTNNVSLTDGTKAFNLMKDANGNAISSNWKDAVFQTGVTQNHTVSVNGGTDKALFFVSGNYTDQNGMVKGDSYTRLGVKTNVSVNATNYLKLIANLNVSSSTNKASDEARSGQNFATGGFSRLALINAPNLPIYNSNGTPFYDAANNGLGAGANTVASPFYNPAQIIAQGNFQGTDVTRIISSYAAELRPISGLLLKTQYGIDYARVEDKLFWSPLHGDGYYDNGDAYNTSQYNKQWVWTNTATYDLKLHEHSFNFLVGTEASQTDFKSWGINKTNLTDTKFTDEQATFLSAIAYGDAINSNSLESYLARINYDYSGKYILSANFRRDGYSGLGKQKWGNFGGASVAWRVSDEKFFAPFKKTIDDVKIKGSWGIVGNSSVGSYPAKSFYSSYYYGGSGVYALGQVGDNNLKWESTAKWDAGFAFKLFNNITFDFDYYYTKTKDLILNVPQAPSKGIPGASGANGSIKTNVGQMQNRGIELSIGADVIKTKDFTWNTNFNFSTNANKVLALANGVSEILGGDYSGLETTNITVVGKSLGQLYLYPTKGIDATTGRRIFLDPDGKEMLYKRETNGFYYMDGTKFTGALKQVVAGNTLPTYFGGWTNNLKYKNFDLTLFFQYSGGNKIYNGTKATTADNRYWNNSLDVLNNYWTPSRTNAKYAYPVYGDNVSNGSKYAFTDWVENGDYVRLKNVILGYSLGSESLPKFVGISSLRIYLQAQNLFCLTKYSGIDPEVLTNTQNFNLAGGTDKNTMPQARVFSIGLNVTF